MRSADCSLVATALSVGLSVQMAKAAEPACFPVSGEIEFCGQEHGFHPGNGSPAQELPKNTEAKGFVRDESGEKVVIVVERPLEADCFSEERIERSASSITGVNSKDTADMQFVSHVFRRMEGGAFSRTEMVFEHGDAERVTTVFNSVGCSYLLSVSHWSESVIGAGSSALEFKEVIEAVRLPEPIKAWAAQ